MLALLLLLAKNMWLHATLTELQCELIDRLIDSLVDELVVLRMNDFLFS